MAEIQLFPDIKLVCGSEHNNFYGNKAVISICISGNCEYRSKHEYHYLTSGKCIVTGGAASDCHTAYSSGFCGITMLIDSRYSGSLNEMFGIRENFTDIRENEVCIFQCSENILKLTQEIYSAYNCSQAVKIKIKAIELFMLLEEQKNKHCEHTEVIRRAGRFICKNISEHYTIEKLSELFAITPYTLKTEFSRYFGSSVYAYTKMRKMFHAAELLGNTDMKIIDIAEEVGYCNASKFASAFNSVIGKTPKNYQMEHNFRKNRENRETSQN